MIAAISDLAWMQALGWTLVHFLWQGLIIGIVHALIRRLVPAEQSSLRYAFGLFSLLALLLAPILTLALLWPSAAMETTHAHASGTVSASLATTATLSPGAPAFDSLLALLVAAWLAGVMLMIGRAAQQWHSLDQIARRLAWRDLAIERLLAQVAERFGTLPGVRVLVSSNIDTPTLIGWLKPVILLPVAVVAKLPRQQLELILAHELGHLRRYDHLVNLAQAIVETLLFYHPVVHWISREVRHEREVCCDNLVLHLTDSEPREYARTLAALENLRQLTPQLAVAASGGMLLDRVRRIVGPVHPHARVRRSRLAVWLVAAGCGSIVVTAVVLSQTSADPQPEVFLQPPSVDFAPAKPALTLAHGIASLQVELASVSMPSEGVPPAAADDSVDVAKAEALAVTAVMPFVDAKPVEAVAAAPSTAAEALAVAPVDAADSAIRHAPIEMVAAADAGPAQATPKIVRMVAPEYPDRGFSRPHAKVSFEFSIDRGGRVRNIRTISGDLQSPFVVAARNALRQWRFDAQSLDPSGAEKFHQDFEFVGDAKVAGVADEGSCAIPMGSHVCRAGHPLGQARRTDERAAPIAQAVRLDAGKAVAMDYCIPEIGSHVCRPLDVSGPAPREPELGPTLKETGFLAGGTN
jgi:beta-lactamase regulating signal transducer with metallopeptidase domain